MTVSQTSLGVKSAEFFRATLKVWNKPSRALGHGWNCLIRLVFKVRKVTNKPRYTSTLLVFLSNLTPTVPSQITLDKLSLTSFLQIYTFIDCYPFVLQKCTVDFRLWSPLGLVQLSHDSIICLYFRNENADNQAHVL